MVLENIVNNFMAAVSRQRFLLFRDLLSEEKYALLVFCIRFSIFNYEYILLYQNRIQ